MATCLRCGTSFGASPTGRRRKFCTDACKQAAWRRSTRKRSVHFSSKTDEWFTPPELFEGLATEFGGFDLDPCATPDNAKCENFYTREDDGLSQEWAGRVFMNPPYGRTIERWMEKAWTASQTTAELVVCLVPARTDTKWWHRFATRGEVRFIEGRIKFGGWVNAAPFPSAIVVFRNAVQRYESGEAA